MDKLLGHTVRAIADVLLVVATVLAIVTILHQANIERDLAYLDPNDPGPQPGAIILRPGDLVRGSGPPVYVIDEYQRKHHIANPEVFAACGWQVGKIRFVPDEALAVLETGPTITSC
jgi:hypothetical protein